MWGWRWKIPIQGRPGHPSLDWFVGSDRRGTILTIAATRPFAVRVLFSLDRTLDSSIHCTIIIPIIKLLFRLDLNLQLRHADSSPPTGRAGGAELAGESRNFLSSRRQTSLPSIVSSFRWYPNSPSSDTPAQAPGVSKCNHARDHQLGVTELYANPVENSAR